MADDSTSSLGERPAWVRLLLPSVTDIVFIGMLAVLVFTPLSVRLLGDAGIGWHIRTGQLILATHEIPRADVFSATMHGKAWVAWEWLYDLLVGWLEREAGLKGVVWFTAAVIAGVFTWTFRLLVWRGADVLVALVLVLLAASASMIHFFARPHVVSWLFVLVWFWILDTFETSGGRLVWLLPPLMLVWVNVHGGFLVGFALLAIYWISAAWQWLTLRENKLDEFLTKLRAGTRFWTLSEVGVLSLAAGLVNPYGWTLHLHIYKYLSNRFLMDHIDEFQSPNFHGVAERCFAGVLLITLIALALRVRQLRFSEVLVVLFAVFSGLYASRNIPMSSLLLAMVVGPLIPKGVLVRLVDRRSKRLRPISYPHFRAMAIDGEAVPAFLERMAGIELSLYGHLWAIAVLLVTGWAAAHGGHLGSRLMMDAHFDSRRFPIGAVDYLEKSNRAETVISPDYWGGYLIYRFYPKALVAVDDRHDLYGEQFLKAYVKLVRVQPEWDELLREYDIPCVLAPRGSALNNILALQPTWSEVYRDELAVAFLRAPAPVEIREQATPGTIGGGEQTYNSPVQNYAH
jgi:hypothetical protein